MQKRNKYDTAKWDAEQVRNSSQQAKKKGNGRWRNISPRIIYFVCVVLASCLLAELGWLAVNEVCALNKEPLTAEIEINEGDRLGTITKKLKTAGIIDSKFLFKMYGIFSGTAKKVNPGVYKLDTDMDYHCLEESMQRSSETAETVTVTIPEGYTVQKIIDLLAENRVASAESLTEAAKNYVFEDYDFIDNKNLGSINRLEGYLFPDTYEFYLKGEATDALNRLLENFAYRLHEDIDLGDHKLKDVITLASIIEQEGIGDLTERKNIASVLFNRMKTTNRETYGYLQLDTTIYYALSLEGKGKDAFDKNLDSPYNTYLNPGLPAGPICNPGLDSINAVLNPNQTNYYYFAAGKDGVNHFFTNYNSHVNFVNSDMYQPD